MIFPSFKTWIAAFELSLPAYLGVMAFPFMGWGAIAIATLLAIATGFQPNLVYLILALAFLVCYTVGFAYYLLLKLAWWLVLKILWNHPPRWLVPTIGLKANLHRFTILTGATAPLTALFLLLSLAGVEIESWPETVVPDSGDIVAAFVIRFYWLWLLSAAYLFHWFPTKSPVDEQGEKLPIKKSPFFDSTK